MSTDFTVAHIGNVPLFMYSMIGLTVGAIVLSTSFDAGSDGIPVPEPIAATSTSPLPVATGGNRRSKKARPHRGRATRSRTGGRRHWTSN